MSLAGRRVVVTGIGIISNIGVGRDAFAAALRAGASKVAPIRSFDTTGYPYAHAAEIHDLGGTAEAYAALSKTRGRSSCLAILAAREAIADAGLDAVALAAADAGVILGTTDGESQLFDSVIRRWHHDGAQSIEAEDWQNAYPHRICSAVSDDLALTGESMMIGTACAAGNYAIGHAADIIAGSEADVMLCGGVDSVCRKNYSGFFRIGAITPDVCRPFDAGRRGILTGEGAAILVLESLDHASARGAPIYAEVLGYATNCDAKHAIAPDRDSIARCIRSAHRRAGVRPCEVDYISAHGTGTVTNDSVESGAMQDVFGSELPPVSSIKSMTGHSMGAASAMGAVACLLGMREGFLPPTVNFESADAQCQVDCVPNLARDAEIVIAENHGFAFGGNNAILVLRNWALESLSPQADAA